MAAIYSKEQAEKWVSRWVENTQKTQKYIRKEFEDMDFTNANARDKMEEIINDMISDCNELIDELQAINFK